MTVHHPFSIAVGGWNFTGFGLAVLMAFLIAQVVSEKGLERRGNDASYVGDLVLAAVLGGLIGAKVYYVILTQDIHNLYSRGGFVFWGGLVGGIVAVTLTIRAKRLPFWKIADVAGPAIAAAYAVGRTGCWAVGDDYGRPWNSPFAVSFPDGAPPSTAANMQAMFGVPIPAGAQPGTVLSVYPTQLLEVALGFLMFWVLWRMRDHRHADGWLFGVYMVLAGIERFLVEFLRAKDDRMVAGMTIAQVIAIAFVAAGFVWMRARSAPPRAAAGAR
ncbi:MAG TPA: prolipoprotein diacylglyceryl transferase family protein [Gemmatimonadaceae bacterium]|nr:prolipoprotein diacylglyceryl transferase family protein [Gemmatimonadaceae bacterium]